MSRTSLDRLNLERALKRELIELDKTQQESRAASESEVTRLVERDAAEFFDGRSFTCRKRRYSNGRTYYDVRTYETERYDGRLRPINFVMIGTINNDLGYGEVILNDRFLRFNPQFEHLKLIRRVAGFIVQIPVDKMGVYNPKDLAPRHEVASKENASKEGFASRQRETIILPPIGNQSPNSALSSINTTELPAGTRIRPARQTREHKYHMIREVMKESDSYFVSRAIGVMRTPYGQKFAVPRQPGLTPHVESTIELYPPYCDPQAFVGLEGFSHIHVLFLFDKIPPEDVCAFKPMVRPPRLGGNKRVGVFATRSPYRPNRIGLSVLELKKIEFVNGKAVLRVIGADMVDGTPVLDIKPYIPFADAIPRAASGYVDDKPERKRVLFTSRVRGLMKRYKLVSRELRVIIAQDPRPAYKATDGASSKRVYFAQLLGYNVGFRVDDEKNVITVVDIRELDDQLPNKELDLDKDRDLDLDDDNNNNVDPFADDNADAYADEEVEDDESDDDYDD